MPRLKKYGGGAFPPPPPGYAYDTPRRLYLITHHLEHKSIVIDILYH
jgi:hypothetical protein